MELGLTDAHVLVSGGSRGIGREIVRVFLRRGRARSRRRKRPGGH